MAELRLFVLYFCGKDTPQFLVNCVYQRNPPKRLDAVMTSWDQIAQYGSVLTPFASLGLLFLINQRRKSKDKLARGLHHRSPSARAAAEVPSRSVDRQDCEHIMDVIRFALWLGPNEPDPHQLAYASMAVEQLTSGRVSRQNALAVLQFAPEILPVCSIEYRPYQHALAVTAARIAAGSECTEIKLHEALATIGGWMGVETNELWTFAKVPEFAVQ